MAKTTLKKRYTEYKNDAKRTKKVFELTREEFEKIVLHPCFYCERKIVPFCGIDRRDNNVGYILSNSLPACLQCNHAKGTRDVSEFIEWIRKLGANLKAKDYRLAPTDIY